MDDLTRFERASLCTTLASLTDDQFTAETLCAGWDAGDVAAHLLVREREPWTGPGLLLGGPFARWTQHRQQTWRRRGRDRLVAALRSGPPLWMATGPLGRAQATEDWIHHQDIRRGAAALPRLDPSSALERRMWAVLPRFARTTLGRMDADGVVALTDGDRRYAVRVTEGRRLGATTDAQADVTISGPISELLLFAVGRAVTDVTVTGDASLTAALERTDRSA